MSGLVAAVRSELGESAEFLEEGEVEQMARQRGQMLLLYSDLSRRMRCTGVFAASNSGPGGGRRSPSPSPGPAGRETQEGQPGGDLRLHAPPPPRALRGGASTAPTSALAPSRSSTGDPASASARVRGRGRKAGSGGQAPPPSGDTSAPAPSGETFPHTALPERGEVAARQGRAESSGEEQNPGPVSEDSGEEEESGEEDIYATLRRANRREAQREEEERRRTGRKSPPPPAEPATPGSYSAARDTGRMRRQRRQTGSRRVALHGQSLGSASQSTTLPPVAEAEQAGSAASEDAPDVQATAHVPASPTYRSIFVLDMPRGDRSAGVVRQEGSGNGEGAAPAGGADPLWREEDASEERREGFAPEGGEERDRGRAVRSGDASSAGGGAPPSTPGITVPPTGYGEEGAGSHRHVEVPGVRGDSAALDGSQWESGSEIWREGAEDIDAPMPPHSAGDLGQRTAAPLQSPIRVGRMGPDLENEIDGLLRKHSRLLNRHQKLAGRRRNAAAASLPHLRHGTAPSQLPRRLSRHPVGDSDSLLWPADKEEAAPGRRGLQRKRPHVRYQPGLLTREAISTRGSGSSASAQLPAAVTLRSLAARRGPWSGRGGGGQSFAGTATSRRGGGFSQDMAAAEEDGGEDAAYSLPMLRRADPNRRASHGAPLR